MTIDTRVSGLPKAVYSEPIFFDDVMLGHDGVISGQKQHGKRYLSAENFMANLDEVLEAIRQGFIINRNTREVVKTQLDSRAVYQCKAVWYHNTFVGIFRDKRHPEKILFRKFYFSKKEIEADIERGFHPTEIEVNPSLKNMKPRRPPTTNPLWVEIRESVPMRYAWEGYDVKDLAILGGFVYKFGNGIKPRFTRQEEIQSLLKKTRFVSQNYFNIKMELLFSRWQKPANVLYIGKKKIVMDAKVHGRFNDDSDSYNEDLE